MELGIEVIELRRNRGYDLGCNRVRLLVQVKSEHSQSWGQTLEVQPALRQPTVHPDAALVCNVASGLLALES